MIYRCINLLEGISPTFLNGFLVPREIRKLLCASDLNPVMILTSGRTNGSATWGPAGAFSVQGMKAIHVGPKVREKKSAYFYLPWLKIFSLFSQGNNQWLIRMRIVVVVIWFWSVSLSVMWSSQEPYPRRMKTNLDQPTDKRPVVSNSLTESHRNK